MKDKILDKSTEMFLTLGFKSVTMDDIAESLGISKKTIYQHYKTKAALVEAAVLYLFDSICNGIDFICEASENPIEELFHIKKFVSEYLKDDKSSPQFQLKKYYPKIYDRIIWKQFEVMYDSLKENLEKGIASGIYRPEIDIDFIARIYFSGMVSVKDTDLFPSSTYIPSVITEKFLEYHIRAIATENGLKILNEFINENNN
ncbi:TetR/AcrR family transcriptional regulator [Galbibacter mesophilus]|uniref:TetR/AcrR family transcriptional regulator n=1 Tax=Galbibacter mesophilus TaxID=379069 RepID=UPI00191EB6F8|nr:TetR/AcrR family transcriptional regulator [Galbibacter mesophilus]MCM5662537.1 TetR/AcrR family transcriptional regulator [Galbibacter mesophilus]